jgi:hypothetical protein
MEFGKALGTVAALKQKRLAFRNAAQLAGQLARLAGKDERRIAGKLTLGGRKRGFVGVGRQLPRFVRAPALRLPLVRHMRSSYIFCVKIDSPGALARLPRQSKRGR